MTFRYSRNGLSGTENILQRVFEILPGALSWGVLLGLLLLSFCRPIAAAVVVIAFDLYWLLRLIYMTIFLMASYLLLSAERQTDWMQKIRRLKTESNWKELYHLVIVPVAKERREIVEPCIQSLADQKFPSRQILVVLALEERSESAVQEDARSVVETYREKFLDCFLVVHPDNVPGEARVKGANAACAAREAARRLEKRGIPFENVVASCFDADTIVSPNYFSCLAYHYLTTPDRTRASFQPIPVYHNNIWDVPGFARVLDIGASLMQMIEATNPQKLVTFSSHSMSFQALVEVDFWPVDMISDDSAIFWKALLHYDGKYQVVPMYVTVSMDVAAAGGWWKTAVNVYRQKRRWAWGIENFPILMRGFLRSQKISFGTKARHISKMLESHVMWATGAPILAVMSWLPALLAGREFSSSVLYYSAPRITRIIFHLSFLSLAATILVSLLLLPKKKVRNSFVRKAGLALEWLLIPVILILFSSLPALDAQTRLLLGKRMEFWVTEKRRR